MSLRSQQSFLFIQWTEKVWQFHTVSVSIGEGLKGIWHLQWLNTQGSMTGLHWWNKISAIFMLYPLWYYFAPSSFFIKLLSTNSTEEAGNTSLRTCACCLLRTSDCTRHTEYAYGLDCCEKMDMNNRDAIIIQWHSISLLLFPDPWRMHILNGTKIKST